MAQYLFPCVLITLEIICEPQNNPAQNFSILKFSFAKDWLLTGQEQACSRITRLFGWLFVCHHAENCVEHRKMVVDCTPLITSTFETLLQTRRDRELVQSVFCLPMNLTYCRSPPQGWLSLTTRWTSFPLLSSFDKSLPGWWGSKEVSRTSDWFIL